MIGFVAAAFRRPRDRDPAFKYAPAWAKALRDSLAHLGATIVPAIDDLKTAVADLQAEVAQIGTDMDAQFAALQAAQTGGNDADIATATASIRASIDALKAAAARDMPATPTP